MGKNVEDRRKVCPAAKPDPVQVYDYAVYCKGVIEAWNSAVADTHRDRLVMWGGGHGDYSGNELYALDLSGTAAPALRRLNDPTWPSAYDDRDDISPAPEELPTFLSEATRSNNQVVLTTKVPHAFQSGVHIAVACKDDASFKANSVAATIISTTQISFAQKGPDASAHQCYAASDDGSGWPNSRHTYDTLAYIPDRDAMYAFGGSLAWHGTASRATWMLDFQKLEAASGAGTSVNPWQRILPSRGDLPIPMASTTSATNIGYAVAKYSATTHTVWLHDGNNLYEFDPARNIYARRTATDEMTGLGTSGVIDPDLNLLILSRSLPDFGFMVFDIDPAHLKKGFVPRAERWNDHAQGALQTSSCASLYAGGAYVGYVYDPVWKLIVGYINTAPHNGSVFLFNPGSKPVETSSGIGTVAAHTCVEVPASKLGGDPPPASTSRGTMGRFNYFPDLDVFVLVTSTDSDAYLLRLRDASQSH